MSYKKWFENHANKHKTIVKKLDILSDEEIVKYFRYDNMKQKEEAFCPLYKENKKCHDIDDLNCYICGCTNFRLTKTKSFCSIDSKDGASIVGKDGFIHQNCSSCIVPHKEKFILENFNKDWKIMMKDIF